MSDLSEKDVDTIAYILRSEGMACKKARVYAHTLMDPVLAEEMASIADGHEKRYKSLYRLMSGVEL